MHLVYVIDNLASGGAQRQAVELAVRLHREAKLKVSFLIYRDMNFYAERLRTATIPAVVLAKRFKYDPSLMLQIRHWLRENHADLVHAFLPRPALWSYLAVRSMARGQRPGFIAAERSSLIDTNLRLGAMQRIIYRGCDAVTVNAESVGSEIHTKLGVASERIHYIPNGISLEEWDRAAEQEPPVHLEEGCFHLGLIGGLRAEKNHLLVLEALTRIGAHQTENWRVWFFGAETGGRGFAERIRSEISQRGLDSIVRIEPPTTQIAAVIRRLDGVLLPSQFEGFPNVALEAMALRVPTIVTPVGDIPNMIEDGKTGLVLDRIDASALAETMVRLRGMSDQARAEMGEQSRAVVVERFSMSAVAKRYLDLYRSITGAGSPPRNLEGT